MAISSLWSENLSSDALIIFNNVLDKLNKTYSKKLINDMFKIGESGVYLLLCGYIDDEHNIYKPGISNTNIYNYTTEAQKDFILDYFNILKDTFKTNYIKVSSKKIKQSVYKQLQARNGTINKNSCKTFTSYESKENYLPILFRYQTTILKAIFIENYLSYAYKSVEGLKFNLGRLFYNGYCYKAFYTRTSGNETESKILNKTFEDEFKNICLSFDCKTVKINKKQNELKYKCLNEYYKQFEIGIKDSQKAKPLDETLRFKYYKKQSFLDSSEFKDYLIHYRTNDIFKYKSKSSKKTYKIKLNYKYKKDLNKETFNKLVELVNEWKNNKIKLSDIIDTYINEIVLALEVHLIEYENSKIKYL